MVEFKALIQKFDKQGEKTGWTYIEIPAAVAGKLSPGNKKSFRVKGNLDSHKINGIALLPMGDGKFIMALNASLRKLIQKRKGAMLAVKLELDSSPIKFNTDFVECLKDAPEAMGFFKSLPPGHQRYFSNWISSAKSETTKAKRIAMALDAFEKKMNYGEMLRASAAEKIRLQGPF